MGLLSKLKTIFNKNKQINTKDTTIVPYDTSLVILPKYKELSKEEQEEVEKYKQEIKAGDISSLILYAGQLSEYANVNVTLLTKVYFKLTNQPADWQLEKMDLEEIMRMRLEAKVNKEELQIYLAGLKKLEQESILRAVAVEEVRKQENKRKFEFLGLFSQAERMHRKNQLEQISSAKERMLITVKTMEQLMQAVNNTIGNEEKIEMAIDVYDVVLRNRLSNQLEEYRKKLLATGVARAVGRAIEVDDLKNHHIEATKRKVLIQKIDETSELANLIFQEKEGILNSQEIKDHIDMVETEAKFVREIARLQRKITVYAYTHKQDVEKLREQLDNIIKVHVTSENKEQLLKRISNIQKVYQIFQETVKEEDLERLYQTKFAILVGDINRRKRRSNPLEEITDKQELEYYAKIVESKIENILLLRNTEFNNLCDIHLTYNNKKVEKILEAFKRIVKSKSGNFSGDKILQDKRILGLIIAFDTPNGTREFWEASYFKRTDTKYVLEEDVFKWEESIPIKTIFYLDKNATKLMDYEKSFRRTSGVAMNNFKWKLNASQNKEKLIEDFKLLYADFFMEVENEGEYLSLPEGIKGIEHVKHDIDNVRNYFNVYEYFLLKQIEKAKKIEFPKSLKRIGSDAFMYFSNIEELVLNEGLKTIGERAFLGCSIKEVILPKSMKSLYSGCFASCSELERIFINEGIEFIGKGVFYNTGGVNFISLPSHEFRCFEIFEELPIRREYINGNRIVLQVRGTKLPRKFLKEFETKGDGVYATTFPGSVDKNFAYAKRYAEISTIEYAPCNQSPKRCLVKYDDAATVLEKITKIEEEYDKKVSNEEIE